MKIPFLALCSTVLLASGGLAGAQDTKKPDAAEKPKAAAPEKPKLTPEQLEAKFKARLTNATLTGRWCPIKDGKLGPDQEDKYTIVSVTKVGGDVWLINARFVYGQKEIVVPIPAQVKWAGDTPVILVDEIPIPGGGVYSARLLVYEKTYAGTWTGGDHGGLLNGVITNQKE